MKKPLLLIFICLLCAICVFPSVRAKASSAPMEKSFYESGIFGTYIEAVLYGEDGITLDNAFAEVVSVFKEVENAVSASIPTSDIGKFNSLETNGFAENISPHTVTLLAKAKELYRFTSGAFNPCAYLLNDLWQLSPRFSDENFSALYAYDRSGQALPQEKCINAFKQLMDFDDVEVSGNESGEYRLIKKAPAVVVDGVSYHMQIDLGAIAKGYASDLAKNILNACGITSGRLSVGGSSLILLDKPDGSEWSIGLVAPDYSGAYASVKTFGALSTSGDYQNYFTENGVRYCHIMNTKTGAPIRTNIRTASVYGDISGAEADALSTAVMAMDFETAKAFVNSAKIVNRGIKIIFVCEKNWMRGSVFEVIANSPQDSIKLQNLDYRLCGFVNGDGSFAYRPLLPDLWFWLTVAVLISAAVFFLIRKLLKNRSAGHPERDANEKISCLKNQKFFLKKDLLLYASLAVLILALLTVFIFIPQPQAIAELQIRHRNVLIYRYDFEKGEGAITAADFEEKITITTIGDKTEIRIEIGGHYNVITVEGKTAKVTDADCSLRKDCVNAFPSLTNAGQTTICQPHNLKITAVGKNGTDTLLNG